MGPAGFSQTPDEACTGARGAGREVQEAVMSALSSAIPTSISSVILSLGSGSSSATKLPDKKLLSSLVIIGNFNFKTV